MTNKKTSDVTTEQALKLKVLRALRRSGGLVALALGSVPSVSATRFYEWVNSDKAFKAAWEISRNSRVDGAEAKLHELVEGGDITAIKFTLETLGADRGYAKKAELAKQRREEEEARRLASARKKAEDLTDEQLLALSRVFEQDRDVCKKQGSGADSSGGAEPS